MSFKAERRILLTPEEISERIGEMAVQIAADYKQVASSPQELSEPETSSPFEDCLVLLCILQSALPFAQELQYELYQQGVSTQLEFIQASSYGMGMETNGEPVIGMSEEVEATIPGRDVVVVEDMIDSGNTLNKVDREIENRRPRSLSVAVLLRKKRPAVPIGVDPKVGYTIPNVWVDGFGIDSANKNREHPEIWAFIQNRTELMQWAVFRARMTVRRSLREAQQLWKKVSVKAA